MAGPHPELVRRGPRHPAAPPIAAGPVRWLGFAAATPARNMAIDRGLLFGARTPAVRLYAWSPPGVSLGWFQRDVDVTRFQRLGYEVVRRLTGGGAVVHHHEVTYAAVLPLGHPLIADLGVVESYRAIHEPIRDALRSLGIETDGGAANGSAGPEPELCFERTSPFDVRLRGRKIVGSAQRRLPDRLLQHGSIVLGPNPLQPGQPSLAEAAGRSLGPDELSAALERAFQRVLGPTIPGALTSEEEEIAAAGAD